MKFLYEYRTKDNELKNGSISAATRDAAFQTLKASGIRPARMIEAPGVLNKILGRGKRWLVIAVLGVLCLVLIAIIRSMPSTYTSLDTAARRQVIGDIAVIEKGIRTGWADVFAEEGERFLASFAIPGVPAGQRNTNEEEVRRALNRRIEVSKDDTIEARQIKLMVEGMKQELRNFLAKKGTIVEYGQRLVQRQEQEVGYYQRAKREIEEGKKAGMGEDALENLWEKRNAELRALGIKLVAFPE